MPPVLSALLGFVVSLFRSRESLRLEHLALRHQLVVYQQTVHRPRLSPTVRMFWAGLSRLWPGWQDALAFVQPHTVIAWQQQRFRDDWQRLSQQGKTSRPAIAKEVRELIQDIGGRIPPGARPGSSGSSGSWALT